MTNSVRLSVKECDFAGRPAHVVLTACIMSIIIITTLGGSGGAPWVFFTYRSLLLAAAVFAAIGTRHSDWRVCRVFLASTAVLFALMLVSVLRIPRTHF